MNKKGFIKIASVETISVATNKDNSFTRIAAYQDENISEFFSGHKAIDLTEKLAMLADEYDISSNPEDYIFEAIRGNTSNVPNENKDAFHKHELLRFDHRLGKQVYRTYENKPHHINHRSSNPKNARGFIVDAHYNDSALPLNECPNCKNKTASKEGRDIETGIHCRKCGEVVKDEFVELLIAIDTQKDPAFANGIKNGILKNGSMGCSCVRTRCNVCGKVAYTRSEFCSHIARNKGKEYDENEPDFNPIAFIVEQSNDKTAGKLRKIAKAFEWCEGVIFDEYSRVHDPADIRAEQYEILQLSAKVAQLQKDDQLRNESEILMLQAKVTQLEKSIEEKFANLQKTAQVAPPPPPAIPGEEPIMPGTTPFPISETPIEEEPGVTVNINVGEGEGVEIESGEPLEEAPALGTPIEELTPEKMGLTPAGPGEQLTPEAMGVVTPPKRGSNNKKNSGGSSMLRFAGSYKHLQAEITEVGNVRIFDKKGTLFVVKPTMIPNDSKIAGKDKQELAKGVLTMIAEHGMGGTIRRTNAIVGPRLAQVLEYYMDDMLNKDRTTTNSVIDEADQDTQAARPGESESATGAGEESDAQDRHETKDYKGVDVLEDRETDVEDEQHDRDPNTISVTEMHDTDKRDEHEEFNMNKSTLDDVTLDHKERQAGKIKGPGKPDGTGPFGPKKDKKVKSDIDTTDARKHAKRLETLYNKRLEAKIAEVERSKKQFVDTFIDRFVRAMKIVARRQSLNLEHSPIKEAMTEALLNPRQLGGGYEYEPMDDTLAVNLVEASINEPLIDGTDKPAWEAYIDGLIERTGEIMKMNDEALMQIEADLKNMIAIAPPTELIHSTRTASRESNEFRQQATAGNLQLTSSNLESSIHKSPNNKREAIRQAVGTTKVASSRINFGV